MDDNNDILFTLSSDEDVNNTKLGMILSPYNVKVFVGGIELASV